MAEIAHQQAGRSRGGSFPVRRFSRELIAMVALFAAYKYGRTLSTADVSTAYENADQIWQLERFLHLPSELAAQQALLAAQGVIEFANIYYAVVHFPATIACLVWLYLRRPALYPPVRRALIGMTSIALIAHLAYPLAPPRMLPNLGFRDTAAEFGPMNVYASAPGDDSLVNQYAAMPSLHVGWAVLVAAGLIAATRSRWRWLWLLHPTITTMAVVGTANHYWIDGIVACFVLAAMTLLLERVQWFRLAKLFPERLRPKPLPCNLGPSGMFETLADPSPADVDAKPPRAWRDARRSWPADSEDPLELEPSAPRRP